MVSSSLVWIRPYLTPLNLTFSILGISVFLYVISIIISRGRRTRSRNPFCIPTQLAGTTELVTDGKARKALLKNSFDPDNVPQGMDCIVIGSGIGGLAFAGFLSLCGKRCLVLEQHHTAGGCCHVFSKKGVEFDTGIHYIGDMHEGSMSRKLMDQLTDGGLRWAKMDTDFDVVNYCSSKNTEEERQVGFVGDKEIMKCRLQKMFPEEGEAIHKYFDLLSKMNRSSLHSVILKFVPLWLVKLLTVSRLLPVISPYFRYTDKSLQEVLDGLTRDDELKCVLSYCFMDYGVKPVDAPFSLHASLMNHFLRSGGYYPIGGASEIAFQLIKTIQKAGGQVLMKASVKRLLTDERGTRVVGVAVCPVVSKVVQQDKCVSVFAPTVVAACGIQRTLSFMDKDLVQRSSPLSRHIAPNCQSGLSCLTLFVSFKVGNEELVARGLKPQNTWMFTQLDPNIATDRYLQLPVEEAAHSEIPAMFVSFPSLKDPSWCTRYPNMSTMVVITLAKYEWFTAWEGTLVKKRGEQYKELKASFIRQMMRQVDHLFPQLRDLPSEYEDLGTPLTNQFYLGSPRGEIYGLDHDLLRFSPLVSAALRPDIGIPGLLISGQDVLCCGFVGAMYGAVLCANTYLGRNLIDDIQSVTKRLKLRQK